MRAILVLGWKAVDKPELLYCGIDGVSANRAADSARESGAYVKLGKLVNPSVVPLPHVPFPKPASPVEAKGKKK